MADLLRSPERAAALGQTARETVLRDYSLDACLPRQLQLINLVAARAIGG